MLLFWIVFTMTVSEENSKFIKHVCDSKYILDKYKKHFIDAIITNKFSGIGPVEVGYFSSNHQLYIVKYTGVRKYVVYFTDKEEMIIQDVFQATESLISHGIFHSIINDMVINHYKITKDTQFITYDKQEYCLYEPNIFPIFLIGKNNVIITEKSLYAPYIKLMWESININAAIKLMKVLLIKSIAFTNTVGELKGITNSNNVYEFYYNDGSKDSFTYTNEDLVKIVEDPFPEFPKSTKVTKTDNLFSEFPHSDTLIKNAIEKIEKHILDHIKEKVPIGATQIELLIEYHHNSKAILNHVESLCKAKNYTFSFTNQTLTIKYY
jgi:hypothetical protein